MKILTLVIGIIVAGAFLLFSSCDGTGPVDPDTFTITATAGSGGAIYPSGSVSVEEGTDKTFTITPNSGYTVDNVSVDGQSKGALTTYTFIAVSGDHTISVTFKTSGTSEVITSLSGSYTDAAKNYVINDAIPVNSSVTFGENTRFEINNIISIKESGSLTIEEGVQLSFGTNGALVAGESSAGRLTINGTASSRVRLSAKSTGAEWAGILLKSGASGSAIKGVDITDAEIGIWASGNIVVNITDSRITGCGIGVFYEDSAHPGNLDGSGFANNEIADCDSFGMSVNPNAVGYLAVNTGLTDTVEIGFGQNVSADQTWRPQPKPYVVIKTVKITDNRTLTLQAGTTFLFAFNAGFEIGDGIPGKLKSEGTAERPIYMGPIDPAMGWTAQGNSIDNGAVIIFPSGTGSSFKYTTVEKASGHGIWSRISLVDITHCRVLDCYLAGIYYSGSGRPSNIDGSTFADNVIKGNGEGLTVASGTIAYLGVNDSLFDTIFVVEGDQPRGNQTWRKQPGPFVVLKSISIDSADVTIPAGCEFYFSKKKQGTPGIVVGALGQATVKIQGTTEKPVKMGPLTADDKWQASDASTLQGGLIFDSLATGCVIDHLHLSGAASNGIYANLTELTINNSVLDSCYDAGLYLNGSKGTISNTVFSNSYYGITTKNSSTISSNAVTFTNIEKDTIHAE